MSPFDWLEASYFYYRPSDLIWFGKKGSYLDKGFNVKFRYKPKNSRLPDLAIGLDDFAGTGYFTREYIVSTQKFKNIDISLGLGWGKFVGTNSYKNPLSSISEGFNKRPGASKNFGGEPSYDQWFRGKTNLFGGIEYFVPKYNKLSLKLEYDPYDYLVFSAKNAKGTSNELRKKDSNINVGVNYIHNEFFSIGASFIKGNTFNLNFNIKARFDRNLRNKTKFTPKTEIRENPENSKNIFYEDLLSNLNNNRLYLQTASLDKNKIDVSLSASQYRNAIQSSSYAASIIHDVSETHGIDIDQINISHINAGVELNKISFIANHFDKKNGTPIEIVKRYTEIDSGNTVDYLAHEFKPTVNFPVIFSSTKPAIVSHIGNPEKFYFGGLNIQNISEIQFSRNLLMSSEINIRVYDNFQNTVSGPGSKMEHVRTDLVQYLKEDDAYVSRLQLDYIWSPFKNVYTKISAGIFESMYGGYGGEILYKPYDKNFFIGAELFNVKQRSFDQRFNFREYKTTTGHINFGYILFDGIEANLSFGRYLAKDDGYTFDIGRRAQSGFKAGVYFTRTDVSAELFGEGSFDKGFYIQIPMDLFSKGYSGNYSTFKISPLTRDGGAKLVYEKQLIGLIHNSTYYELENQWKGFLN